MPTPPPGAVSPPEPETPEQLEWRREFSSWPESKLRMYAEPNPSSVGFDGRKAFARALLAERESAKRDARETATLRAADRANLIAWIAIAMAAISIAKDIAALMFN